jgi:hypothetical protein
MDSNILHAQSFFTKIETEEGATIYCICDFQEIDIAQKEIKMGELIVFDGLSLYKGERIVLT